MIFCKLYYSDAEQYLVKKSTEHYRAHAVVFTRDAMIARGTSYAPLCLAVCLSVTSQCTFYRDGIIEPGVLGMKAYFDLSHTVL